MLVRVLVAFYIEQDFLLLKEQQAPEQAPAEKACFSFTKTTLPAICGLCLHARCEGHTVLQTYKFLHHKYAFMGWALVPILARILTIYF